MVFEPRWHRLLAATIASPQAKKLLLWGARERAVLAAFETSAVPCTSLWRGNGRGWPRGGPIDVPNRIASEEIASLLSGSLVSEEAPAKLRGNGISPGVVAAEVRGIRSPAEYERFTSGAVLVAPATDPNWTPLFARAVGVLVELGGALSHAGIVAREYGIPCVANIPGVTQLLRDGDVVRLDGSSGEVTVVSRQDRADPAVSGSS